MTVQRNSKANANPVGQIAGTPKVLPVSDLVPNTWNYNVQGTTVFRKLVNAIKRHGFTKPVIVRALPDETKKRQIVDGEHRWRAAIALGMTRVPVVDLGLISDEHARELTIILNELAGEPNEARLGDLLRDINKSESTAELLDVMPFAEGELDAYLSTINFSFTSLPEEDPLASTRTLPVMVDDDHRLALTFVGPAADEVEAIAEVLGITPAEAILNALRAKSA